MRPHQLATRGSERLLLQEAEGQSSHKQHKSRSWTCSMDTVLEAFVLYCPAVCVLLCAWSWHSIKHSLTARQVRTARRAVCRHHLQDAKAYLSFMLTYKASETRIV